MEEIDRNRQTVEEMLEKIEHPYDAELVCTSWVLVSEWAASDGEKKIYSLGAEGTAQWNRVGLLRYAMESEMHNVSGDDEE